MPDRSPVDHVLPLVAAAACWGVGTVITKQVLADIAPLTLLPVQLAASVVFLLAVSWCRHLTVTWSPALRRLAALGLLNPGGAYALGLLGLTSVSASLSVLLWSLEPVLILLLAVLVLRERVSAAELAVMAIAVLGVLLVVHRPGAAGNGVGVALTLAAVAACAFYTVLARRLLLDDASVSVVLVQQVAALALAVLLVATVELWDGDAWGVGSPSRLTWAGAVLSGVLYYGLAFWLYLSGLRGSSAAGAGFFLTLIPVFGVAAGHLVDERLTGLQWMGAVVVVAAVIVLTLLQTRGRPVRRPSRPEEAA